MQKSHEKVKIRSNILLNMKMLLNVSKEKHHICSSCPDLLESGFGFPCLYNTLEWASMLLWAQNPSFPRRSRFPYHPGPSSPNPWLEGQ